MVTFKNHPAHILAYGHSNQTTFRDSSIQGAYDAIAVPGTIATYYQQATGGFVLALRRPYFIDPRTPLFQQDLQNEQIRASFYTLSCAHGPKIEIAVDRAGRGLARLWADIRSTYDEKEAALSWLDYQRGYVGGSSQKLQHYEKLVGRTLGNPQQPAFYTNPYWMADGVNSPEWTMTYRTIVEMHRLLRDDESIVPIVTTKRVGNQAWHALDHMIESVCEMDGVNTVLVWIDGFRELEESVDQLRALKELVLDKASKGIQIGMLYGGYFSVALGKSGLWAFGNGVGYSESRSFPELPSTGAPPPRYYLYGLHRYIQPDIASRLLRNDPSGRLQMPVQLRHHFANQDPTALSYHELMTHFVLSRGAEIKQSSGFSIFDLRKELTDTANYIDANPLLSALVSTDHLRSWSLALA